MESTKLSLYIPGFLMEVGSWFVDREEEPEAKTALSKMRSVSICVREGRAYKDFNASGKYEKKVAKMKRQHFEEMISVRDAGDRVSIQLRQNKKEKIRQVVVIADDGCEEFVFLRLRCNIHPDDLKKIMEGAQVNNAHLKDLVKI